MSELLEAAKRGVALALAAGAKEASASASRAREVEIEYRDGAVEKVTEATSRGLSIAVYVDGRYAAASTSDLRPDALAPFASELVALARALAVDPHRRLPDPERYAGQSTDDLELEDPTYGALTADERRRQAAALEAAARAAPGHEHIISAKASVSDTRGDSARVTSNGFEGERTTTAFWHSVSVTVRDPDGRKPDGYGIAGGRHRAALVDPALLGHEATGRAIEAIGSKKLASATLPMIVEARSASRLISPMIGALSGRALQQKQSFLEGELGKKIANERLTVIDDPLRKRGLGSRTFDGDGFATKQRSVIEGGVLRTYFLDDYYARKLGEAPTTGGTSNLVITPGKRSHEELARDVGDGFVVTGFLGGNSNSLTGDFSFGVQGFRLEKGQRTTPFAEMNISGNLRELWAKLSALGNDPYPYSSYLVPTLVFDEVQLAGA